MKNKHLKGDYKSLQSLRYEVVIHHFYYGSCGDGSSADWGS
jgi:hypothetical protein